MGNSKTTEKDFLMNPIRVGTYVTHSQRPAWGVGKVFGQSTQHVLVGFTALPERERFKRLEWRAGLLEKSAVTQDAELDSWKVECDSTCHYIGAVARVKRAAKAALWTREEAMERFLHKYSDGFIDLWYKSSNRNERVAQHELWKKTFPGDELRTQSAADPYRAGQAILAVLAKSSNPPLNAKTEMPKLSAAFEKQEAMRPLLNALADLLDAETPTAELWNAYLAGFAVLGAPAAKSPLTWSIVTSIPSIAKPSTHLHVRPTPLRKAAAGLGFELKFQPKPNWVTYQRILAFGNDLKEFIKPRSGEDMFDVLAFILATAE
jgi:hypothetical protein